jgi:hypothetical protein
MVMLEFIFNFVCMIYGCFVYFEELLGYVAILMMQNFVKLRRCWFWSWLTLEVSRNSKKVGHH